MTKITPTVLLAAAALICAAPSFAQGQAPTPPPYKPQQNRASPHETISEVVAGNRATGSRITLTYGRPFSAKGGVGEARKIWGGLVPWDKADRMGADEATLILLQHSIVVGSTTIAPGAYTLYIVPSENGTSKLAFSSALGKWGIPVDETKDVARVDLVKEPLADQLNQLTITIENAAPDGGVLRIKWEKTQFSLPFKVKK